MLPFSFRSLCFSVCFVEPPRLAPFGSCGGKGQHTVAFQHLVLGRTDPRNLEEVVHDPQTEQTSSLCSLRNHGKRITERSLMIGPGKVGDL
jgi:hypothetical protein